ncbi:MAG: helix-hairpin-helix domain-containing protein [Candidatus Omnitrophota bacterium]
MNNKRGFILLLTFVLMVVLTFLVGALMYMVNASTKDAIYQIEDYGMLNVADAGVQYVNKMLDDGNFYHQNLKADLRGATASGTASHTSRMCYVDGSYSTVANNTAILQGFDSNYAGISIDAVYIVAKAGRQTGGSGATLQVSYSINGVTGATKLTQALPNSTNLVEYTKYVSGLTWSDILNGNFTLTATRTAGNRNIYLDALYLRVRYSAHSPEVNFSDSFSSVGFFTGTMSSEDRKVHLNTASQSLLSYLMQELGISSSAANTLADNIITYRTVKPFDSVEELQQVEGMTTTNYNLMHDYVTVYTFINPYVQRTTGARAPININAASLQVLKAVFDPLGLGTGDAASLANDIVNSRPTYFTCFYSADSTVTTDFYDFVRARTYLTAAEQNKVLDNADASLIVPVSGAAAFNCATTEFSYGTSVFEINLLSYAPSSPRMIRIQEMLGGDKNRKLTTYYGDPAPAGYRRETFEVEEFFM